MSETPETVEFTERDEADLNKLLSGEEKPQFHTVLEVWREVLSNAPAEGRLPMTPRWAVKLLGSYAGLTFADTVKVKELYFSHFEEMRAILDLVIDSDENCLTYSKAEDDALENALHYKEVLTLWQKQMLQHELEWDAASPTAAAELAALGEIQAFFFGEQGITQFLGEIQLRFDDDDQAELVAELEAQKVAWWTEAGVTGE